MNLGDVLDGAFRLTRNHFGAFILSLGAVAVIPTIVVAVVSGIWAATFAARARDRALSAVLADGDPSSLSALGGLDAEFGVVSLLLLLLFLFIVPLSFGVPVHIAAAGFRTGQVTAGDGLRAGFRRYWALLGTLLLQALVVIGIGVVIMLPFVVVAFVLGGDTGSIAITMLGGLVTFVGVVIASIRLTLTVPLVMVEGIGPGRAISRSNALVKGRTFAVFGTLFIVWLIMFVVMFVVTFGSLMVFNLLAAALESVVVAVVGGILSVVIQLLAGALQYALIASALVFVYFDQRVRTEGYDLTESVDASGQRTAPSW